MNRFFHNKKLLSFICLSLSSVAIFAANNADKSTIPSKGNKVNVETDKKGTITIEISVKDFDTIPVLIGSDKYYMLSLPEGHSTLIKGDPDLPVISKSFIIPDNSDYTIKVIEDRYSDYKIPIAPSKGSISRKMNWNDVKYEFSDAYKKNSYYPSETVGTGDSYNIRDIQGNNIQICPFRYNPVTKTLRVSDYLKIEISFSKKRMKGNSDKQVSTINDHWYPMIKHKFVNSDYYFRNESEPVKQKSTNRSLDETSPKMLVICYDSFVPEMRNFIIHKNNLGIPTTMVKMSDVGTTANDLKAYIQNAYNNDNDLTYVLLVGDEPQIPTPIVRYFDEINPKTGDSIFEYGASDPIYSLVDGEDNYPDIVIGRFSAETNNEVKVMVQKVIQYENQNNTIWHHKAMGIASNDTFKIDLDTAYNSFSHGILEMDWQHLRNIRDTLLTGHYSSVMEFYEGSQGLLDAPENPNGAVIIDSINAGVSLINYCGHGKVDGWLTGDIINSNEWNLEWFLYNEEKLPFIYSIACYVGKFDCNTTPCFAETWQRAQSHITGNPTGCIGFYGSSVAQWWHEPMDAQDSFNKQLIDEEYVTIGMLCYSSACDMMDNYSSGTSSQRAKDTFNTWILFGDPSLQIIPNNNIGRTVFLEGILDNDSTYTKDYVDVYNATITDNTDIVIDCQENTIINGEFEVELGSTLLVW